MNEIKGDDGVNLTVDNSSDVPRGRSHKRKHAAIVPPYFTRIESPQEVKYD
jgi:hypothetical protein